jgi:predicted nucleotidyltransferase
MLNKSLIINSLKENQDKLKSFGIKQLGLFGSYARNQENENSDIDLLIVFEKGKKNINNLLGLHTYLESLFGKKTELITEDSISDFFKKSISNEIEYVGI